MYSKTKYMIFLSALILIFAVIILAATLTTKPAVKNQPQDIPTSTAPEPNNRLRLPENKEIRVSEELRSYVNPESDPLNQFDEEPQNNTDTIYAPKEEVNKITEIETIEPLETKTKQIENPVVKNKDLYTPNNTKAEYYEVNADFKLGTTDFYVISYKGDEIQTDRDFINKKYYIYKDINGTLTRCYYLFDREQRKTDSNAGLITVSTDNERTTIDFNGINKVSRRIFNSQLLGPYGDSAEEQLHFQDKTDAESDSSIPVIH